MTTAFDFANTREKLCKHGKLRILMLSKSNGMVKFLQHRNLDSLLNTRCRKVFVLLHNTLNFGFIFVEVILITRVKTPFSKRLMSGGNLN